MGFLFDPSKGETPETIKRQRDIIRALMGAQRAPQNVGEGLSALGDGIVANVLGGRADRAEAAGMESASAAMGPLAGMFGGGAEAAGGTVAPPSNATANVADGPKGQEAFASGGGDIEGYIRQAARARNMDEDKAVRVAMSEGGLKDPFRQGDAMLDYGREESYGPFQLHMRQGGVGERALKSGIDPRKDWKRGVDYALDEAAQKGWGQWYGAAKAGVGKWDGLKGAHALGMQPPTQVASLDPSAGMPPEATAMLPPDAGNPGQEAIAKALLGPTGYDPAKNPANARVDAMMANGGAGVQAPAQQQVVQTLAQAPQQAPMQVAQADMPMGGGQAGGAFPAAPPDPGSGEGKIRQLLAAAQNPYLSESQQAIVKALLGEEMQKRDPQYQMGLEKDRLQLDALRNPKMSPGDAAQLEFGKQKFASEQQAAAAKAAADAEKEKFSQTDTTADNARADAQLKIDQGKIGHTSGIDEYNAYMRDEVNAGRTPLGRLEYEKALRSSGATNIETGTIPQGYQAVRDANGRVTRYEPIPGGPADTSASDAAKSSNKAASSDVIVGAAQKIRTLAKSESATGLTGAAASLNPASDAAELYRQIDVLKSNATIENLSAMRQASPTGGALGNVTEGEGKMLAAKSGALDPKSPYFKDQLDDYERTLLRVIHGKEVGDAIFKQTREPEKRIEDMTDQELEELAK